MKAIFLAAAAALAAFGAEAGEISLNAPLAGATLDGSAADMAVYYTKAEGDAYRVVATYVTDAAQDPAQLVMELRDGDAVSFSLPGEMGELYSFARKDGVLIVSSRPADFQGGTASRS